MCAQHHLNTNDIYKKPCRFKTWMDFVQKILIGSQLSCIPGFESSFWGSLGSNLCEHTVASQWPFKRSPQLTGLLPHWGHLWSNGHHIEPGWFLSGATRTRNISQAVATSCLASTRGQIARTKGTWFGNPVNFAPKRTWFWTPDIPIPPDARPTFPITQTHVIFDSRHFPPHRRTWFLNSRTWQFSSKT